MEKNFELTCGLEELTNAVIAFYEEHDEMPPEVDDLVFKAFEALNAAFWLTA